MEDVEEIIVPSLRSFVRENARQHGCLLNEQERAALAKLVRNGDTQAREKITLALLRYCEKIAYRYSESFSYVEYEDLFQMAALKVLEVISQAAEKYSDPFPYIFLAVRREIIEYCLYRAHLIRIPETLKDDGKPRYTPYKTISLDTLLEDDDLPEVEQHEHDYSALHEAVKKLEGRYKTVITMRFGLNGHPPTSLWDIGNLISNGKNKTMAGSYQSLALRKLRKFLVENK